MNPATLLPSPPSSPSRAARTAAGLLLAGLLAAGSAGAQTLVNGGVVSGTISTSGEVDSYTFQADAGEGYQIQVADVVGNAFTPLVRVYDPSSTLLQSDWGNDVASITRTAATTGTYTVEVSDWNSNQTGDYDVHFTLAPGANEGGSLPNGGSVTDAVDLGDLDSYTFEAEVGEGYQIQVADLAGGSFTPVFRIYDPNGTLLETDWGNNVASITRAAATSGVHTVVVSDWNHSGTGPYTIYFTLAPGANEGGLVINGGSVSGTIDLGDLDSFTLTAFSGEDVVVEMTEVNTTTLTPLIRLYGPTGTLLKSDWGNDVATITQTAPSTGTYTVVASDRNHSGTGDYGLFSSRGLESYCTPGMTASGCQAEIAALGDPSTGAGSGFVVSASAVEGDKDGIFFFGANGKQASPWGTGTSFQCVVPPVKRSPLQEGTGTGGACDGAFAFDFNAYITAKPNKAPPTGSMVQIQCWFRDPQNTSNQSTSLSDALEFTLRP